MFHKKLHIAETFFPVTVCKRIKTQGTQLHISITQFTITQSQFTQFTQLFHKS